MQDVQLTLPAGTKVGDRYVVERLLGKGGFGAVYLVRDQRVRGNLFALKEIVDSNRQERARFAFECEVLKRLDQPSLPRVYRVFEDDSNNRAYMLMDYIQGPNLEILRQKQPEKRFSLLRALEIMAPIMTAVAYLHNQTPPIIHRDIKPSNIIVPDSEDSAVLVDFGIAKEFDPDSTTTAIRRCSPGYGAPEQYSKGTNTQTDIYGLGATLYALLTGTVPEDAFYRMTQLGSKHDDPLVPINQLAPGIPWHIWAAIQRAMSINSTDRFQTVEQFWQVLTANPPQEASYGERLTPAPLVPMQYPQYPLTPVPAMALNSAVVAPENQTTRLQRKKRPIVPIFLLLIVLALVSGLAVAYWPVLFGSHTARLATPTAVVHHQATAVPKHTPSPKATAVATATPVPVTPTTGTVVYPNVAGTHSGTAHNTNDGSNASMSVSLSQSQSKISGSVTISLPLKGSGSITSGFVKSNNSIQFVVSGYQGNAPLLFTGYVQSDGSMSGQYCSIDSTGQCNSSVGGQGTWSVGASTAGSGSSLIAPEWLASLYNVDEVMH